MRVRASRPGIRRSSLLVICRQTPLRGWHCTENAVLVAAHCRVTVTCVLGECIPGPADGLRARLPQASLARAVAAVTGFHRSISSAATRAIAAPKTKGAEGPRPRQRPIPCQSTPAMREAGKSSTPSIVL